MTKVSSACLPAAGMRTKTRAAIQLLIVTLVLSTLLRGAVQPTLAAEQMDEASAQFASTFLVHFALGITLDERDATLAALDVELVNWLEQIQVAEVRLNEDGLGNAGDIAAPQSRSAATVARQLQRAATATRLQAGVLTVEPNPVVYGLELPNDPDLAKIERSYGLSMTHAYEGWQYTKGSGEIIIAILDTGLNLDHPEFAGRIAAGYDFVNNDATPMDDNGHGTHTAGIAAAGLNNNLGMAGICPECRLMPVKVLNQNNAGTWSGVAKGVLHAADHGAHVINLSLGATVSSQTLENAIAYAETKGAVVVAAAGNMGVEREFFPAALPNVLAVSATNATDERWNLSNYGTFIDVAAPGYNIFSTYHDQTNYYSGYTYMSGTSMAAPYVAGLAGLLFSQDPERSAEEVRQLITSTADRLDAGQENNYFGQGRVNIARALSVSDDIQWLEVAPDEESGDEPDGNTISGSKKLNRYLYLPFVTR